ncbi:MAG TPA: hypothetical protein VES38_03855 [Methylotenera sp.]|nr:hypothetical protein [Methylotenera sp.]
MSKEQDQLNEFKVMVEALSQQVKSSDDLGLVFIDKLSMQFDDYLAHQSIYQNESNKIGAIKLLVTKFLVKLRLRDDKSINTDPVIQYFINELIKTGVITSNQFELLSIHKMIRVDDNGSYFVMRPGKKDFTKAKLQVLLLLILTPLTLVFAWEESTCIYPGLPIAFILGAALGLLWRTTYNLAWGREKLAQYLRLRYPWVRHQFNY